jgi:hypothetical protein
MPALEPSPLSENLEARIHALQATIKALIEDAAAKEAAAAPGVPAVVCERAIWQKAGFCACRAFDLVKDNA